MSFIAVAIGAGVAGIAGAAISSNGAQSAANTQAAAANNASNLQYSEFQQQEQNQQPWINAGQGALGQMQVMNAKGAPTFTQQDFLNNQDPAYQFDMSQGNQAIERSAAASGGLNTGGTLKSLTQYAQGQASNEYQNAYNRFMNGQNTQFNRLASVAGLGQTANGQLNSAGSAMAGQVGSNMMGAANAQGAASIASANAFGNTLSSLGNSGAGYAMQSNILSQLGYNGVNSGVAGSGSSTSLANLTPANEPYLD